MDLSQLAVANRGFGGSRGAAGVNCDGDVEGLFVVWDRASQRGNDQLSLQRPRSSEELVREIFLGLRTSVHVVLDARWHGVAWRGTYDFDLCFPALFDTEWESLLQTGARLAEVEEGLVWALGGVSLGGGEDDLERVVGTQSHRLRERLLGGEPGSRSVCVFGGGMPTASRTSP